MGSLFQGRVRLNMRGPRYERLEVADPWIGLDDDEDDDELINTTTARQLHSGINIQEGNHVTSNGEMIQDDGEEFEELTIEVGNEDETFLYDRRMLERQGSPLYKTFARNRRFCSCDKRRLFCTLSAVVICITVACLFFFLLPCPSSGSTCTSTRDFAINITGAATESSMRLFDVNKDGVQDIIFGYARVTQKLDDEQMQAFCEFINMTVPCAGVVAAVDGTDGTFLWELNVECEVFAILCDHLDANGDGQKDCLIAGRLGVLYAVDSTNGASIWSADPTMTNSSWNFYQPQVVPDLDGDGVMEVVVTHGGNGDYQPSATNRDANRILLLSGKTGKSLGNYLETPDKKETYSAVTLYEREDGAIYVLFGTGGETVKGSLWAISLWDLYCHVIGHSAACLQASSVPALQNGKYEKAWGNALTVTPEGVREILRSVNDKGVMVPTILADLNKDGTQDLIVSLFNGTVVVLDGRDLRMIWTTGDRFGEFETYSTLAPGHFNSDDVPDVLIRLSHGTWKTKYNSTMMFILDGRDGRILWSTRSHSEEAVMSSPLSVRGRDNKDIFLFWTQGRRNNDTEVIDIADKDQIIPQEDGKQDRRHRRHNNEDSSEEDRCNKPAALYECELFVMNRDTARTPLRITTVKPYKYYYNALEEKPTIFSPENAKGIMRRKRNHHQFPSDSSEGGVPKGTPNKLLKTTTSTTQTKATYSQHTTLSLHADTTEISVNQTHTTVLLDLPDEKLSTKLGSRVNTQSPSHTMYPPVEVIPNYTGHPFEDDDDDGHDHVDNYANPEKMDPYGMDDQVEDHHHDANETLCTMYSSWLRSTATLGDLDNDGILDIVYMLNTMTMIRDAMGAYIGSKIYTTLVKRSLKVGHDYITLDPENTFCDASIQSDPLEKNRMEEFDFILKESKWGGYMGTNGSGQF